MHWPEMFFIRSGVPAWKRLIDRPLTTNECMSLIAEILSDRSEVEAIKRLSTDEAQSFVDVLDKVFPSLVPGEYVCRLELPFSIAMGRCWTR